MTDPGDGPLLDPDIVADMHDQLPRVAGLALDAVTSEVPEYAGTLSEEMARTIEGAIVAALRAFLLLAEPPSEVLPATPLDAAREGAYDLGRGEARGGRTADALLAAYRIGARVSWRELSALAVAEGAPAGALARFAELVFAYIDELSAASVAGHADEVAASGRLRQRRREQLGRALLTGADADALAGLAEQATWTPPESLTAVLVASARVHDTVPHLHADTLVVPADAIDLALADSPTVLLVPDIVRTRDYALRLLTGRSAVVGPARAWQRVAESLRIAVRARELVGEQGGEVVDAAQHLAPLVVSADRGALEDLRAHVLAPLSDLAPDAAARLADTLQAWLLHLGRRGEVAAALHVHPQTVRYRMLQLRERYGDRLDDPNTVQALVVALTLP